MLYLKFAQNITMVAEALLYKPVQILPNHHARLSMIAPDAGPMVNDRYIFSNYMFLAERPPSWFWGCTGVVRSLPTEVTREELEIVYLEFMARLSQPVPMRVPESMKHSVVEIKTIDGGKILATINMFQRQLKMRVA